MLTRKAVVGSLFTLVVQVVVISGVEYDWPPLYPWPEIQKPTGAVVDNRPVMKFYAVKKCGPCRAAKEKLTDKVRKELPFQVEIADDDVEKKWGEHPVFTWRVGNQGWNTKGFSDIPSLVAIWKQTQKTTGIYPTRWSNWTGPDGEPLHTREQAIRHLLFDGEHRGKFTRPQLEKLSLIQLQSLHSDDHERKVQWSSLN